MANTLLQSPAYYIAQLKTLGRLVRDTVIAARSANSAFAGVSKETAADTIYQLDTHVEPVLEHFCAQWAKDIPGGLVLIAEGLQAADGTEGLVTFPPGTDPEKATLRLIVDPIDGTRGLMYDKRSAWVLLGLAPNKGTGTRLSDIQIAVQVEVPTSRQGAADTLWAARGGGAFAEREWRSPETANSVPRWSAAQALALRPSTATTLAHGFASVTNFFPGTKVLASTLMEQISARTVGPADTGKALIFDDQYISTGGQLYELIVGHDRFTGDLRPLFYQLLGKPTGLCAHPYDLATALIATEAGVLLTNGVGQVLDGPLDVETALTWAGFANAALRDVIEPVILEFLTLQNLGGTTR